MGEYNGGKSAESGEDYELYGFAAKVVHVITEAISYDMLTGYGQMSKGRSYEEAKKITRD